jgi:hypothetical protein
VGDMRKKKEHPPKQQPQLFAHPKNPIQSASHHSSSERPSTGSFGLNSHVLCFFLRCGGHWCCDD